ncbi:MAG: VOC family protein [Gemmataceae bacterium]|nr:VOC family protein [Gemmataceae bacterium]
MEPEAKTAAARPVGVSHLVLNVRDLEASHRFWTEVMGFEQCGELKTSPGMKMRFYRGGTEGHHHDLALAEVRRREEQPEVAAWSMAPRRAGLNHVAIAYPDREAWLGQVAHLRACGVTFHLRGEHGMSHSVYVSDPDGHGIEVLYDLPRGAWEEGLDEAFNYFKELPTEGAEALEDGTAYPVFSGKA